MLVGLHELERHRVHEPSFPRGLAHLCMFTYDIGLHQPWAFKVRGDKFREVHCICMHFSIVSLDCYLSSTKGATMIGEENQRKGMKKVDKSALGFSVRAATLVAG